MPARLAGREADRLAERILGAVAASRTLEDLELPAARVDRGRRDAEEALEFAQRAIDVAERHEHLAAHRAGGIERGADGDRAVGGREGLLAAVPVAGQLEELALEHRVLDEGLRRRGRELLGARVRGDRRLVGRDRLGDLPLLAQDVALRHVDRAIEHLAAEIGLRRTHALVVEPARVLEAVRAHVALGEPEVRTRFLQRGRERLEVLDREVEALVRVERVDDRARRLAVAAVLAADRLGECGAHGGVVAEAEPEDAEDDGTAPARFGAGGLDRTRERLLALGAAAERAQHFRVRGRGVEVLGSAGEGRAEDLLGAATPRDARPVERGELRRLVERRPGGRRIGGIPALVEDILAVGRGGREHGRERRGVLRVGGRRHPLVLAHAHREAAVAGLRFEREPDLTDLLIEARELPRAAQHLEGALGIAAADECADEEAHRLHVGGTLAVGVLVLVHGSLQVARLLEDRAEKARHERVVDATLDRALERVDRLAALPLRGEKLRALEDDLRRVDLRLLADPDHRFGRGVVLLPERILEVGLEKDRVRAIRVLCLLPPLDRARLEPRGGLGEPRRFGAPKALFAGRLRAHAVGGLPEAQVGHDGLRDRIGREVLAEGEDALDRIVAREDRAVADEGRIAGIALEARGQERPRAVELVRLHLDRDREALDAGVALARALAQRGELRARGREVGGRERVLDLRDRAEDRVVRGHRRRVGGDRGLDARLEVLGLGVVGERLRDGRDGRERRERLARAYLELGAHLEEAWIRRRELQAVVDELERAAGLTLPEIRHRAEEVELEIDRAALPEDLVELDRGRRGLAFGEGDLAVGAQERRVVGRTREERRDLLARRAHGLEPRLALALRGRLELVEEHVETEKRRRRAQVVEGRRDEARRGALRREHGTGLGERGLAVGRPQDERERAAVHERLGMPSGVGTEHLGSVVEPVAAGAREKGHGREDRRSVVAFEGRRGERLARRHQPRVRELSAAVEDGALELGHARVDARGLRLAAGGHRRVARGDGGVGAVLAVRRAGERDVARREPGERGEREGALVVGEAFGLRGGGEILGGGRALGVREALGPLERRVAAVEVREALAVVARTDDLQHLVGAVAERLPHRDRTAALALLDVGREVRAPVVGVVACRARDVRERLDVLAVALAGVVLGVGDDRERRVAERLEVGDVVRLLAHGAAERLRGLLRVALGEELLARAHVALGVVAVLHEQDAATPEHEHEEQRTDDEDELLVELLGHGVNLAPTAWRPRTSPPTRASPGGIASRGERVPRGIRPRLRGTCRAATRRDRPRGRSS